MKVNVTDIITVKSPEGTYKVKVEDASKGDIISGTIEQVISGSYQVGQVHDFNRNTIAE